MSCDWDIKCIDCDEKHGFQDMNHDEPLMLALVRHADAIAALHAVVSVREAGLELVAGPAGRQVDTAFFKKHQGHHLRPIDEYGRLSGNCYERVECPSCGTYQPCRLPAGHETKGDPHQCGIQSTDPSIDTRASALVDERDTLRRLLSECCDLADETNGDPSSCSYSVIVGDRVSTIRREAGIE